jgi:hypothetical protein
VNRAVYATGTDYIERGWPVFVLDSSKRSMANCRACSADTYPLLDASSYRAYQEISLSESVE